MFARLLGGLEKALPMSGSATRVKIKTTPPELRAARQLLEGQRASLTSAKRAVYHHEDDTVELVLRSGVVVQIPRRLVRELANAPEAVLRDELTAAVGGEAISVNSLDADISVYGLLRDVLGLNIQRIGGLARTKAKASAARANGAKGGRPRKQSEGRPPAQS
jgi:hypothetical protein